MNVSCPNCATVYRVDPAKVPEVGVRARCAVCSAVFAVTREGAPAHSAEPVGAAAGSVAAPPPRPEPPRVEPPPPEAAPPPRTAAPAAPVASAPAAPVTSAPAATATAAPPRPVVPPAGAPPRPAAPPRSPAAPVSPAPSAAAPQAPSAPPPPAAAPAAPAHPARAAGGPPAGRPVNPFLSQDPSLKARRLARALISDMVVYHPAKRQEGLRDGTLKELFEEEIKKSWEEYADQVGRDVADSTTYFREALNEILAGGRQIF